MRRKCKIIIVNLLWITCLIQEEKAKWRSGFVSTSKYNYVHYYNELYFNVIWLLRYET